MTYRVVLQERARAAIREHARYIAVDQQSPENAARWLQRVWDVAHRLETFPMRGFLAPENGLVPYEVRAKLVGSCLLLYHVDEASRAVHVVGFRHGARLPRPEDLPGTPPSG